ncbi:MAG: hypothetical protein HUU17_13865 [Chthonomonadales bacterium]|nr:hypothetical protein [Chthonomonadales bacterium]
MTRRFGRLGAALLAAFALGALRVDAAAAADPEAAYKALTEWYTAQLSAAKDAGKTPDVRSLMAERAAKAKEAVQGMDIAATPPSSCLALAQLYQLAGMAVEAGTAAQRFLTTNPPVAEKGTAQGMALSGLIAAGDADAIIASAKTVQPADTTTALNLAYRVVTSGIGVVRTKKGVDPALALINDTDKRLPWSSFTGEREKPFAESIIVQIGLNRSALLEAKGDRDGALSALENARKRLPEGSRNLRQLDVKLKQMAIIGKPAIELVKDRQYGDFTDLATLKGRVVVLDFGAHW